MAKKRSGTTERSASRTDRDEPQAIDFEEALSEVEKIVSDLEVGELGLTESLGRYELGVKRLKQCHRLLELAEQKVNLLAGFDADGNPVTRPLDEAQVRSGAGRSRRSRSDKTPADKAAKKANAGAENTLAGDADEASVDDSHGLF